MLNPALNRYTDEEVLSPNFIDALLTQARVMKPFIQHLNWMVHPPPSVIHPPKEKKPSTPKVPKKGSVKARIKKPTQSKKSFSFAEALPTFSSVNLC